MVCLPTCLLDGRTEERNLEMQKNYAEHHASVLVNAPVHQVYALFTHFNDFPKFMSFVKEVTYYDDQRSHWVADVVGRHEWDAVNEGWIPDRQVGWRSTNGLENFGKVTFTPGGSDQTRVDVFINYNPPAGVLGDVGEKLGAGSRFDKVLQDDLTHFARMVDEAPAGALDPESSNYLFRQGSAAARGTTTGRQNETMYNNPNAEPGKVVTPVTDRDITGTSSEDLARQQDSYDTGAVPFETRETYPRNPSSTREENLP